jgi:hypothetical protein
MQLAAIFLMLPTLAQIFLFRWLWLRAELQKLFILAATEVEKLGFTGG